MFPDLEFVKTCLNGLRNRIEKVENKLLKRIEKVEDWAVSEDQATQAVADYFAENPIIESDPTVPAWAKQPNKPTYTAAEIGAQPDMFVTSFGSALDELTGKTVVYVASPGSASPIPSDRYPILLMRSAIDNGQASIVAYDAAGKTWGGNVNFSQGSIGLTERTLTASDIGAIPVPATAEVGQVIVVKAVDENGVPTAWEPVDLPSGEETWELVDTVTLTSDVVVYDLADLAVYRKVKLIWAGTKLSGTGNIYLKVLDDVGASHDSQWLCNSFTSYMRLNVTIDARHFLEAEFVWNNNLLVPTNVVRTWPADNSSGWAKTLELVFPDGVAESLNGTITVYGVRA